MYIPSRNVRTVLQSSSAAEDAQPMHTILKAILMNLMRQDAYLKERE